MAVADPDAQYAIDEVDIDDAEFVKSLTNEQFVALLAQAATVDAGDTPADLGGAPALHQPGDAVVFFSPPARGGAASARESDA